MANLYRILQVDPKADEAVIQAAFKVLAAKHHPDHKGNPKIFKAILGAREVLTDPRKRSAYDKDIDLSAKKIVGSYEVVKYLAEGALGRTYVVRHLITKKLAVLKACLEIGPEFDELMVNESSAIWDIRHYAFPAIREVTRLEDGTAAIIMSYIPGPTLEQAVKHLGAIDPVHVCWIFERLLAGLNYLHANGVIHGDIKPQNIILQPDNHGAVMIDFGLAMIKPTKDKMNVGYTDHFSPPEQLSTDRKPLIPESDLYALGMSMLYAFTGKLAKRTDPEVKKLPKEIQEFLMLLTHPDILKRPNWETDLLRMLGDIRVKCFGSRNTRGLAFPTVPCDIVT